MAGFQTISDRLLSSRTAIRKDFGTRSYSPLLPVVITNYSLAIVKKEKRKKKKETKNTRSRYVDTRNKKFRNIPYRLFPYQLILLLRYYLYDLFQSLFPTRKIRIPSLQIQCLRCTIPYNILRSKKRFDNGIE